MRHEMRALVVTAALAASVTACGGGEEPELRPAADEPAAATSSVAIKTFMFAPDPITVKAGTRVTFENADQTTHTATSGTREKPDGRFDERLGPNAKAVVMFDEPGRYPYVCTLHQGPGMEAEVIVE